MNRLDFWKYAQGTDGQIEDVFSKFASENDIVGVESRLLWNHISQDMMRFSKYGSYKCADMTIDPDGTIHITNSKGEEISGDSESEKDKPEEDKPEEDGVTTNAEDIKNDIGEAAIAKPQSSEEQHLAPSTVFDRL